ncbi:putative ribonuclease H-like domain-containing protein [Tanacetum coccineum]
MVLKAVLMRSGLVSLTTARPVNIVQLRTTVNSAKPMTNVFNKAHSTFRRPINNKIATKNNNFNQRVNTVKGKNVNTARPKAVLNVAKGNQGNPQQDLDKKGVIDSGCSRHMTGNMSYLTDIEEIDGGYVAFGGNPKGGKITGRGIIKTGNLDFENVYFVRELKFNLFSVSQMCDKKNSVLFNDTECIVLSPNFKLTDESYVLLQVSRKNHMYSVDLKNIVPKGGLTCLFAKAASDESKLWHRRLGHINFKTINKLVKGNLVRGKFDSKADEGFFVGYSINSKAFKVFNSRTRIVEENLHVQFSENTPNIAGSGPNWLFDIDALTKSVNYKPVVAGNQSNGNVGTKACDDAGDDGKKVNENPREDSKCIDQKKEDNVNSTNNVNVASINKVNVVGAKTSIELLIDPDMSKLEDIVYSDNDEDVGTEVEMTNLDASMPVSPIPATRVHKDHPVEQIIEDLNLTPQTRRMTKNLEERVDLPNRKRAIGTKWVFENKKDERENLIKNKARLVAQGYIQEKGIDYDEVFAPVARIEAIRLFLEYASFKDFVVYQMDVKSAFFYGKIEEEVYVCQPLGFEDPDFPDRVYKVEKALYELHQAPRAWYETLSTYLLDNRFQRVTIYKTLFIRMDKGDILLVQVYVDDIIFGSTNKSLCTEFEKMMHKKFQMSSMGELTFFLGLQVKQNEDGIFISQDKYVTEILKKFGFTDVKTASTPMETQKPLLKDEDGEEVDVHLYRSMIGSLMYLTSSRLDIMFIVCACARYQVNPKVLHLYAVKRIFRYLKGQPKLGLWYLKDSPFDLVAYTDCDYARASLDRKSTTGDSNEKKLIQMIKIHTDKNVADLLTKAFDGITTTARNLMLLRVVSYILRLRVSFNHLIDFNLSFAFLAKSAESKGFEQIVDFLNASSIKYALTVNLTIYTSCIEQFWSSVKVKTVNGEQQLQALVDRKKIIITEATIKRDLQLEDADGIDCLPNATIFEQLTLMGMVKNLDSAGKFLMHSRFMQVFLDNQQEGMINHNRIYIAPSHTKKVFANMKRQGKDFSGRVTPLFPTMVVQAQEEMSEGSDMPTDPHHTPTIIPPSTSQPQRKQRPRKPKRKDIKIPQSSVPMENVADEAVYEERDDSLERATTTATGLRCRATKRQDTIGDTIAQTRSENVSKFSNDPLLAGVNTPRSGEDSLQLKELMEFCTKLQQRVLDLENTKTAQAHEITNEKLNITLRYVHDADMFGVHDLDGDEVFVETEEPVVNAATTTSTIPVSAAKDLSDVDMTLAQALAELKSTKPKAVTTAATTTTTAVTRPKAKGLVIQEQEQASTPITSSKDKGKGIMVEEPLKIKKKDQVPLMNKKL